MAELKKVNTRIIHKHATAAVWHEKQFIPLQGEIIIYDPGYDPTDGVTYTYERMKVGDGTKKVTELPFVSNVSDWNQNDETSPDYIKNRTHYTVVETGEEVYYGNGTLTLSDDRYVGEVYTNIFEEYGWEEYQWVATNSASFRVVINDNEYHVGSSESFDVRGFGFTNLGDVVSMEISSSLLDTQVTSLEVAVYAYQKTETVHTLSEKYIPNTIARTSVVNTLQTEVNTVKTNVSKCIKKVNGKTPDSSGAVSIGYDNLSSKPFNYYTELDNNILDSFDGHAFQFEEHEDGYYISFERFTDLDMVLSVYTPLNITWDGVEYTGVDISYESGDNYNEIRYCGDSQFIDYPFYIRTDSDGEIEPRIYTNVAGSHTIKITTEEKFEVNKINVNHIPNTIARTSDIPNVDNKVSKSGDTMTGALEAPAFKTGVNNNNYFQTKKIRGEGDANTYYHAVDFGYSGKDSVDFHEYGGVFNFYKNTAGTKEGGTLIGAITPNGFTGKAASASKLDTARNIKLTGALKDTTIAFDGSADVNVEVPAVKEAYLEWGGRNITEGLSPIDAACSNYHSANRFAYANPAGISIEYSNDGGITWNDSDVSDDWKIRLINGQGSDIKIGQKSSGITTDDKVRISFNASTINVYTRLKKLLINISTDGASGAYVTIEQALNGDKNTFTEIGTYNIFGWSDWNSIPLELVFGGYSAVYAGVLRLTFGITGLSNDYNNVLRILDIIAIGTTCWSYPSNMARNGHLYDYDYQQNAIFPAKVRATEFTNTSGVTISLPAYTSADEGKILQIVNGVPTWVSFTDTLHINCGTASDLID